MRDAVPRGDVAVAVSVVLRRWCDASSSCKWAICSASKATNSSAFSRSCVLSFSHCDNLSCTAWNAASAASARSFASEAAWRASAASSLTRSTSSRTALVFFSKSTSCLFAARASATPLSLRATSNATSAFCLSRVSRSRASSAAPSLLSKALSLLVSETSVVRHERRLDGFSSSKSLVVRLRGGVSGAVASNPLSAVSPLRSPPSSFETRLSR